MEGHVGKRGSRFRRPSGELAAVIYHSLAQCYAGTAEEIEALTGKQYPEIHIVGAWRECAVFKNRLTARIHGKTVEAGTDGGDGARQPCRADDCGGELKTLSAARACIADSFTMEKFEGEKGRNEMTGVMKQQRQSMRHWRGTQTARSSG